MSTTTPVPQPETRRPWRDLGVALLRWFDSGAGGQEPPPEAEQKVDWPRILPFVILHVACLGVFWVGWSPIAVAVAVGLYALRMFAITAFYHRYFSHRAFKTSRAGQLLFAILGNSAVQRGPLWWAAHHRKHHRHSDQAPGNVGHPVGHFRVVHQLVFFFQLVDCAQVGLLRFHDGRFR